MLGSKGLLWNLPPSSSPALASASAPAPLDRLLSLVALSRCLQNQCSGCRSVASACSTLGNLYLVQLRQQVQLQLWKEQERQQRRQRQREVEAEAHPGVAPLTAAAAGMQVSPPSLDLFASMWMASNLTLREAAQLLLSAYTDPHIPGMATVVGGGRPSSGHQRDGGGGDFVVQGEGQGHQAEQSSAMADSAVAAVPLLLPHHAHQLLQAAVNLGSAAMGADHYVMLFPALVVSGSLCLHYSDSVPPHLFALVAHGLVEVMCSPPALAAAAVAGWPGGCGSGPALAAAMLTEALKGPGAVMWRAQLLPWDRFLARCGR